MKTYDTEGNLLDESKIDLSKGSLAKCIRVNPDAIPIDNVVKFAWDSTDYEEVQVFTMYTQEELESMNSPSEIEILKKQVMELQAKDSAAEAAYARGVQSA